MAFKIGDKVRLKEDYPLDWKKGDGGIVERITQYGREEPLVVIRITHQGASPTLSVYQRRLELVPEEKTEQELVDEYMAALAICRSTRDTLASLGYVLRLGGGKVADTSNVPITEYYFYKEVRSVIELKAR